MGAGEQGQGVAAGQGAPAGQGATVAGELVLCTLVSSLEVF